MPLLLSEKQQNIVLLESLDYNASLVLKEEALDKPFLVISKAFCFLITRVIPILPFLKVSCRLILFSVY